MDAANLFNESLVGAQMPQRAFMAFTDSLKRLGFPEEGVLPDYSFSGLNKQRVTVNAMAFVDRVHRTPAEYAGLTLFNHTNGLGDEALVRTLSYSLAPFHLIHRGGRFSFWASTGDSDPVQPIRPVSIDTDIPYDQLAARLHEYAPDLKPEKIVDVKQGRDQFTIFPDIQPLQLSLFLISVTRDLLGDYFGRAVAQLRRSAAQPNTNIPEHDIHTLAIQLLGALVLADTGVLGDEIRRHPESVSLSTLIATAHAQFKAYFQLRTFDQYEAAVHPIYQFMRGISYAGFVPEMLTDLYARAYDPKQRQATGSYDTPLYLTRRIWDMIPVEFLRPAERKVADMTCGWGSFLISAYSRLARLTDMPSDHLRDYLHGNDSTPFTAQLAKLGLLLSTSTDNWHVDSSDALTWTWLQQHSPNIIVGNPPFAGRRGAIQDDDGDEDEVGRGDSEIAVRSEKANRFLSHAIERIASGGYLAMLMPHSFVVSQAGPTLRKQLLQSCDLIELWELPKGVFTGAKKTRTIALLAQKRAKAGSLLHQPVRLRTIQTSTLPSFRVAPTFTASAIEPEQTEWGEQSRISAGSETTHLMDYYIILPSTQWKQIRSNCATLQNVATVFIGPFKKLRPTPHPLPGVQPTQTWWLGPSAMPRPFHLDYTTAKRVTYPDDFAWPRYDHHDLLMGPKLLLLAKPGVGWEARVHVAMEHRGYIVSHKFWILIPKPEFPEYTLEVLAAIVSWKLSNAWIIEHLRTDQVRGWVVEKIPIPRTLTANDLAALTSAVHSIEQAAQVGQEAPEAQAAIDRILIRAYGLDDATIRRLDTIARWPEVDGVSLDLPENLDASRSCGGVVQSVQPDQNTITLWLTGFPNLQTVPIVPPMPGWMLRPGAAFAVKIPRAWAAAQRVLDAEWGRFYPQEYAYLDEDEAIGTLTEMVEASASRSR